MNPLRIAAISYTRGTAYREISGYGDIIQSNGTSGIAEYRIRDFPFGQTSLKVEYASAESRPIKISWSHDQGNRYHVITSHACAQNTGSWNLNGQIAEDVGSWVFSRRNPRPVDGHGEEEDCEEEEDYEEDYDYEEEGAHGELWLRIERADGVACLPHIRTLVVSHVGDMEFRVTRKLKDAFLADLETRKALYEVPFVLKCNLCSPLDEPTPVKNPKSLPCLHSFCQTCLEQQDLQANRLRGGTVQCKQCGAAFQIPRDGIKALGCSAFVDSLLKSTQRLPRDLNGGVNCETCEDEEATVHCMECSENIGKRCASVHKKARLLVSHRLVPLEDVLNGKIEIPRVPWCQKHPDLEISTYCKTCSQAACADCAVESHRRHRLCALSVAAAASKDQIVSFAVALDTQGKEAEKRLPAFVNALSQLESQRPAAEEALSTSFAEIRAAVDAREKELKGEMDGVRDIIAQEMNQVETAAIQLREFRVFVEGLLVQGTPLELIGAQNGVKARKEVLEKLQIPSKPSKRLKLEHDNVDQLKQAVATFGSFAATD